MGLLAILIFLTLIFGFLTNDDDHIYEDSETVVVWINKIGPYHNPTETYTFEHLPLCLPETFVPERKWGGIGAILEGNEWKNSGIRINFKVNLPKTSLCTIMSISDDDSMKLMSAVSNHYWYQMFVDELPVWAMVGELVIPGIDSDDAKKEKVEGHEIFKDNTYLYLHRIFTILYNGNQIVGVGLNVSELKQIKTGESYEFTYSVNYVEVDVPFNRRYDRFLDYNFFEHKIHWLSIINSIMIVVFLCVIVITILLRTLERDIAKYELEDESIGLLNPGEDSNGWKQIHGDVFRLPNYVSLYSIVCASGIHLALTVFFVILTSLFSKSVYNPGSVTSYFIIYYLIWCPLSGYWSGSLYKSFYYPHVSPNWKLVFFMTSAFLPTLIFIIIFGLNFISIYYDTMNTIPASTIFTVIIIWVCIDLPLTLIGTFFGRSWGGLPDIPCRINAFCKPIIYGKWYTRPTFIALTSGLFPFASIFVEIFYIFTSFWSYKFYYVYGFMLFVFCILSITCICVTILGTYILLNSENYHWHWTSFFSSASTALYVFTYGVYYFFKKTKMEGFLQLSFYFGYLSIFCLAVGLICGFIGNYGVSIFVKRIYSRVKID